MHQDCDTCPEVVCCLFSGSGPIVRQMTEAQQFLCVSLDVTLKLQYLAAENINKVAQLRENEQSKHLNGFIPEAFAVK